jgi:hypothetical protein
MMGKLIAVLVILGIGFGIYRTTFYKSPAYKAYLQWCNATSTGDCKTLQAMSDGAAKKWVELFCGGVKGFSAASMVADLSSTPAGAMRQFHHDLENEDEADDGTVSLRVVETVLGRNTNFNKLPPPRRHDVKLREMDGVWKVLEFNDEDIKP